MREQFEVSDCSSLHRFLGMKIDVRESEIAVSQEKSIDDLLKRYNMEECKPVQSPLPAKPSLNEKVTKNKIMTNKA